MPDGERVVAKTTVPRYQKEIWVDHADSLGMTQSEYIRTMVQAGRRGFDPDPVETTSPASNPGGDGLKDHVHTLLHEDKPVTYAEIIESIVKDIELEVDDYLRRLLDEDRVEFSNREGYTLNGIHNGDD